MAGAIPELLDSINQALADLIATSEKNGTGAGLAGVEQALADVAAALEKRPAVDLAAAVEAIGKLKLQVTVPPAEHQPFQTLLVHVTKRDDFTHLLVDAEISLKRTT